MSSSVKDLVKKGARDGFVTVADINTLVAESGEEPEKVYALLEEKEIEVRDNAAQEAEEVLAEPESLDAENVLSTEEPEAEEEPVEDAADTKPALDELLDDPVKNYLKQIGQIPLLSAD